MGALFKWHKGGRPGPKLGDERYVRKFLLLPKEIGGEYRWLGREEILQRYREVEVYVPEYGMTTVNDWVDMVWCRA